MGDHFIFLLTNAYQQNLDERHFDEIKVKFKVPIKKN